MIDTDCFEIAFAVLYIAVCAFWIITTGSSSFSFHVGMLEFGYHHITYLRWVGCTGDNDHICDDGKQERRI